MDSVSKGEEPFPSPPPPYFIPEQSEAVYCSPIHPQETSTTEGPYCPAQTPAPEAAVCLGASPPLPRFVSYEAELGRLPGLAPCPFCQTQVTTQVTFHAGAYAWIMCLVFVLCGLFLGCCLIPFFVGHFKDAYHSCPRCFRVLHVTKKTCC